LPIDDCRWSIEELVWQLPPLSISNRQSTIGNARQGTKAIVCEEKTLALRGD
jgi:hypothetical protein